jgi:hypothetical protein
MPPQQRTVRGFTRDLNEKTIQEIKDTEFFDEFMRDELTLQQFVNHLVEASNVLVLQEFNVFFYILFLFFFTDSFFF